MAEDANERIRRAVSARVEADRAVVDALRAAFPLDALVAVYLSCVQSIPSDARVIGYSPSGEVRVRLVYGTEMVRDVSFKKVLLVHWDAEEEVKDAR